MLIEYDPEADALYIRLSRAGSQHGEVTRTHELDDQRRVDIGEADEVLGVEILWVSRGFSLAGLPSQHEIGKALNSLGSLASVACNANSREAHADAVDSSPVCRAPVARSARAPVPCARRRRRAAGPRPGDTMPATPSRGAPLKALLPYETLVRDIVLIVAGSALLALCAQVTIHLPIGPVPITGQTFAVLLLGAVLGPRLGAMAAALYVLEGIANLPVYASGAHGWGVITGSSGGYLLSYPVAAFAVGYLARSGWDRRPITLALAMLVGNVVIYVFGLPWLANWTYANEADARLRGECGARAAVGADAVHPRRPREAAACRLARARRLAGGARLPVRPGAGAARRERPAGAAPRARRRRGGRSCSPSRRSCPGARATSASSPRTGRSCWSPASPRPLGAWLLHRREISARLGHLWIFAAAALGGTARAFVQSRQLHGGGDARTGGRLVRPAGRDGRRAGAAGVPRLRGVRRAAARR